MRGKKAEACLFLQPLFQAGDIVKGYGKYLENGFHRRLLFCSF